MKKKVSIIAALLFSTQIFIGCRSAKPSNAMSTVSQPVEAINICKQTVVYHFSKVKLITRQEEKEVSSEIVVNPTERVITINDDSKDMGKGNVSYPIELVDCNSYDGSKTRVAVYRTWIQRDGEEPKERLFKFEIREDGVTISFTDEKVESVIIKADAWEVVKQ